MKKYILSFLAITLVLTSINAFAGVKKKKVEKTINAEAIVQNLKVGLTSDNFGLKVSSAYVLGQLVSTNVINPDDASETIIPLMKIMNNEETDEARIVAALALYYLESDRAALMFGFAAKYDKSARFSRFSSMLYREYNKQNK